MVGGESDQVSNPSGIQSFLYSLMCHMEILIRNINYTIYDYLQLMIISLGNN